MLSVGSEKGGKMAGGKRAVAGEAEKKQTPEASYEEDRQPTLFVHDRENSGARLAGTHKGADKAPIHLAAFLR
jgi:hypothetical protein